MAKKMQRTQKAKVQKTWRLVGFDTFSSEWYSLDGAYPSKRAVEVAARKRLEELEVSQPASSSGGQGFGGIQDRVYIEGPDGNRYKFIG